MGSRVRAAKAKSDNSDLFAASWNAGASPFTWVKTADEILAKAVRKLLRNSESGH